jgi:ribulose 1,5-bisphosphate carboxylase large subunit-like protein
LETLWHDAEPREVLLKRVVDERLAENPPPQVPGHVVATYFFAFRSWTLEKAVAEIAYHATSGIKNPPPGSLLAECTAKAAGIDAFDATGRMGLLHIAYPLKMMRQADGHLTSCDLLHTLAGAIIFDVYENQDARLIAIQIPEDVIRTFPGPAYGPEGLRKRTSFPKGEPAFGTILKPTAGITADDVGQLLGDLADSPLLMFVKEDENLYPNLDYSPVVERTRKALASIEKAKDKRNGRGLIFAPHLSSAPNEIVDTVLRVVEAGATGVMFSESFALGTVRMVREATKNLPNPPAIYGHNAGIGVRTHAIRREVIDTLARLDGIDFRQTAPVKPGEPFLLPYGAEWEASEKALTQPIPGINPVMIARAGALDQGNLILNLMDAEKRGILDGVLFLAGSAINSIKDDKGKANPRVGLEAMGQALAIHRSGDLRDVSVEGHLDALADLAKKKNLTALVSALRQRYPGRIS